MEKATRRRYTLEYKQESVRLVAKALGIVEQTLANWVKAAKAGQLRGLSSEQLSAQHDRDGSTATGRKSKTSTLMRDAF
jgi:transposase